MWYQTKLSEKLGIRYPIILGPLGAGYSTEDLVSKVSNLGGLGSYGAVELPPDQILEVDRSIRSLTDKPYAINLWISDRDENAALYTESSFQKLRELFKPYFEKFEVDLPSMPALTGARYEEKVQAVLEARPPAFSFIFGIPSEKILNECKNKGIQTIGTATTPDEAQALEEAGVDVIIASGFEAGGHRGSFLQSAENSLTGTFSLIPQVADRIRTPFAAAGGIADGRGIAAAMMLGAQGVQIGTAFLACEESKTTPLHRDRLFSSHSQYTVLTKLFSGRLARGLRNKLSEELSQDEFTFAPFPLQRYFMRPLYAKLVQTNNPEYMAFMSGQSAPLLRYHHAGELFAALVEDTTRLMEQRSG